MTLETDFNVSPYFDDYSDDKNFHRVLFKPSVAVQARELTQLQTILQNQIERFGDFVVKNGSIVKGVSQTFSPVNFVKIRDRQANNNTLLLESLIRSNTYIRGLTSNVFAELVKTADGAEVTSPNYKTLFVKYIQTGTDGQKQFSNNETLILVNQETYANTLVTNATVTANVIAGTALGGPPVGQGLLYTVGEGVIFQKGHFVRVEPQSKVISKYNLFPNTAVGFDIRETIINNNIDDTLNDNAQGATNFQAPGADRLKLEAVLATRAIDEQGNSQPFFSLAEFKLGQVIRQRTQSELNELGNKLAQRTYEESGDYILNPFVIRIQEHLNNNTNFGVFYSDRTFKGVTGDPNKLVAHVEKGGVAYVKGFRNEIKNGVDVPLDKGTNTVFLDSQTTTMAFGGYVVCNEVCGKWSHIAQDGITIDLYDGAQNAVTSLTYSDTSVSGSKVGEAKFLTIKHETGNEEDGTGNAKFRVYLYDITMNADKSFASDVKSLVIPNSISTGRSSFADIVLTNEAAKIVDSNNSRLLFKLGKKAVKTMKDQADDSSDTIYTFRTETTGTISAGDKTPTFSQASGFDTGNQPESVVGGTDDYIITINQAAETDNLMSVTFNTGSNTVTRTSGNTISNIQVGDLVKCTNTSGGNAGIFKVHAVGASDFTLTGQPSFQGGDNATLRKYYYPGTILDLSKNGSDGGSRGVSVVGSSITVDTGEDFISDISATVSYKVRKSQAVEKDKVVRKRRYVAVDVSTADGGTTGPWTLGISDVYKIRNVYKGSTASNTHTDVTKHFQLDQNQFDTHYENSRLVKKTGSTLTIGGSDILTVKLDYFNHDRTSGVGYFSVDSYPIDDVNAANTTAIQTAEIPKFKSKINGRTFDLRDVVDFRPSRKNTTDGSTSGTSSIPEINTANTTMNHSTIGTFLPAVDETLTSDITFYLPRIDKIVLTKNGNLDITRGVSDLEPKEPRDQADAITLAKVFIPPFPSLSPLSAPQFDRPEYTTKLESIPYKRFTMKDIGKLENRVNQLEYYTALNLLEQSAKEISELNSTGIERFKNGFFADPFIGHNFGDVSDADYKIAIDSFEGEARPTFTSDFIELRANTTSLSTDVTDDPRIQRLTINAGLGTEFKNYVKSQIDLANNVPVFQGTSFGSATAKGYVSSYSDANTSAAVTYIVENVGGTSTTGFGTGTIKLKNLNGTTASINSTATEGAGDLFTLKYIPVPFIKQDKASKVRNPTGDINFDWKGKITLNPAFDTWKSENEVGNQTVSLDLYSNYDVLAQNFGTKWGDWVETGKTVNEVERQTLPWAQTDGAREAGLEITTTTITEFTKTGTKLSATPVTTNYDLGEFVKDVSVIPYMREKEIKVTLTGFRPNTRLVSFFDGVNVKEYVKPTSSTFADISDKGFGNLVTTDANGNAYCIFRIPNNDKVKFLTGAKKFTMADVQDLRVYKDVITTSGEAVYTASGIELFTINSTISTQTPVFTEQSIFERDTKTTTVVQEPSLTADDYPPPQPAPVVVETFDTDAAAEAAAQSNQFADATTQTNIAINETHLTDAAYSTLFGNIGGFVVSGSPFHSNFKIEPLGSFCLFEDPIAQSFTIPRGAGLGVFIPKIDVFFQEKDVNFGIDLEIREMENGQITKTIVPFGVKTLTPSEVYVSSDGRVPTPFIFNTPLFLSADKEYAMVVKPHGNSPRYRIFCAELGSTDLRTSELISKPPASGILFTSANDNTYNAFQAEDLKFTIHKAYFLTNKTGTLVFENYAHENFTIDNNAGRFIGGEQLRGASKLQVSDLGNTSIGSNTMQRSSIAVGDRVFGQTSKSIGLIRQIISSSANQVTVIVDSANTFTLTGRGESIRIDRPGHFANVIYGFANSSGSASNTSTAKVYAFTSYNNKLQANNSKGGFSANISSGSGYVRGQLSNSVAQITSVNHFKADIVTPRVAAIPYANTKLTIDHKIAANDATSTVGSYQPATIGDINKFTSQKQIAGRSLDSDRTYFLRFQLKSDNPNYSPVVDKRRTPGVVVVNNIINSPFTSNANFIASEEVAGGSAVARYITKPITLADGQDAEDLKVYINAFKPTESDIKVFVRFKAANDPEALEDKVFSNLPQITFANVISRSSDPNDFREFIYGLPSGANASGNVTANSAYLNTGNNNVLRYHAGSATYDTFKTFQIKVVMTGNNSAIVPRMTDIRSVALQV